MKKGLFVLLTVIILLCVVGCSYDPETIRVSEIKLEKSKMIVSSASLNSVQLKVSEVIPENAGNKKVTFEVKNADKEIKSGLTVGNFVSVDPDTGMISFNSEVSSIDIHEVFTIVAKSVNGITSECDIYFNYKAPDKFGPITYEGGVVADNSGKQIVDLTTEDDEVIFDYHFDEDEYPFVTYTKKEYAYGSSEEKTSDSIIKINAATNTFSVVGSGYAAVTATALAEDGKTAVTQEFEVYVNRIVDAEQLSAFLVDTKVDATDDRTAQLKAASTGYLTSNVSSYAAVVSNASVGKTLYLNGNTITFEADTDVTAIDFADDAAIESFKIVGDSDSKIILPNNSYDATLIRSRNVVLSLEGGMYEVSGSNTIGILSANEVLLKNISGFSVGTDSSITSYFVKEDEEGGEVESTVTAKTDTVSTESVIKVIGKTAYGIHADNVVLEKVNMSIDATDPRNIFLLEDCDAFGIIAAKNLKSASSIVLVKARDNAVGLDLSQTNIGSEIPTISVSVIQAYAKNAVAVDTACQVNIIGSALIAAGMESSVDSALSINLAKAEKATGFNFAPATNCSATLDDSDIYAYGFTTKAVDSYNPDGDDSLCIKNESNLYATGARESGETGNFSSYALYVNSGKVEVDNSSINAGSDEAAFGLYNLGSSTLTDTEVSIYANKEENGIMPYVVAGIYNEDVLSVSGLRITVNNTGKDSDNTDVYGIFNEATGTVEFSGNAVNKISVTVANGGACALKNYGEITFSTVTASFSANRTSEVLGEDNEPDVLAIDNVDNKNLGIHADMSTLSFVATNNGKQTGSDLNNIVGWISSSSDITFSPKTI